MINIALIDDEKYIRNVVERKIKLLFPEKEDVSVYAYQSADVFLQELDPLKRFHIVITDIEMPGTDGIEFATKIKTIWPGICIIFLTSYSEYAANSYKMNAYQYIVKTDIEDRLQEVVSSAVEKVRREIKNYIVIGNSIEQIKIYYADILYIQKVKSAKYVEFITVNGTYKDRSTLLETMKQMKNHEIVLVERGYAVNMRHITGIRENIITLSNGDEVVVSRMRMSKVKEQISRYWRETW